MYNLAFALPRSSDVSETMKSTTVSQNLLIPPKYPTKKNTYNAHKPGLQHKARLSSSLQLKTGPLPSLHNKLDRSLGPTVFLDRPFCLQYQLDRPSILSFNIPQYVDIYT